MSPIRRLTRKNIRFIRFCFVGASGVIVNLGIFTVAHHLLKAQWHNTADAFIAANLAGFALSVFTNFLLNDYWTWGDREKRGHGHFFARLAKFYLVSSIAGGVQLGVATVCYLYLAIHEQGAVLIGIAIATGINYVANNVWTFREKPKTESPAELEP
jgi:dolichol-phosphate mannosyltransferase